MRRTRLAMNDPEQPKKQSNSYIFSCAYQHDPGDDDSGSGPANRTDRKRDPMRASAIRGEMPVRPLSSREKVYRVQPDAPRPQSVGGPGACGPPDAAGVQ